MDAVIEFEVDEEALLLARQYLESQNLTLEDVCRDLLVQFAEQQRATQSR